MFMSQAKNTTNEPVKRESKERHEAKQMKKIEKYAAGNKKSEIKNRKSKSKSKSEIRNQNVQKHTTEMAVRECVEEKKIRPRDMPARTC